jgi:hypothetical protein
MIGRRVRCCRCNGGFDIPLSPSPNRRCYLRNVSLWLLVTPTVISASLLGVKRDRNNHETETPITIQPVSKVIDVTVVPAELALIGKAILDTESGSLTVTHDGDGFSWSSDLAATDAYQIWITYYCEDEQASARMVCNGETSDRRIMPMAAETMRRLYDQNGEPIKRRRGSATPSAPYAFREFWGTVSNIAEIEIAMTFAGATKIRVDRLELIREHPYRPQFDPLLEAALDFYVWQHEPGLLPATAYQTGGAASPTVPWPRPRSPWKTTRLAGVDFSCLLFGLAAHHPELGRSFFNEATRFTFGKN